MAEPTYTKKVTTEKLTDAQETNRLLKQIIKLLSGTLMTDIPMSTGVKCQTLQIGSTQPQMVVPENINRKRLTIKNVNSSAIAVYVSDKRQMNATGLDAFVLNQGEQKDFSFHTGEMHALAASSSVSITIAEE